MNASDKNIISLSKPKLSYNKKQNKIKQRIIIKPLLSNKMKSATKIENLNTITIPNGRNKNNLFFSKSQLMRTLANKSEKKINLNEYYNTKLDYDSNIIKIISSDNNLYSKSENNYIINDFCSSSSLNNNIVNSNSAKFLIKNPINNQNLVIISNKLRTCNIINNNRNNNITYIITINNDNRNKKEIINHQTNLNYYNDEPAISRKNTIKNTKEKIIKVKINTSRNNSLFSPVKSLNIKNKERNFVTKGTNNDKIKNYKLSQRVFGTYDIKYKILTDNEKFQKNYLKSKRKTNMNKKNINKNNFMKAETIF